MSQEKLLIILVSLFLVSEIIKIVVENNTTVKKVVRSNPFLDFVYKDAVGYVHIFEKTEMPNQAKLEGAVSQVIDDAKAHGYRVSDQDRALIEGAVEYAVNQMHLANKSQKSKLTGKPENAPKNVKTVENMTEQEVKNVVPDAPQLAQTLKEDQDGD